MRRRGIEPPALLFESIHAQNVGVTRQTVYTWKARFDEGGVDALREVRLRGRPARPDADPLEALRRAILEKPTEHGFGTDLWTLYYT